MNFTCPQCGVDFVVSNTKLSNCSFCNSSLLVENNSICISELKVAKNTEESLFEIGNTITIRNTEYIPNGYALYEYGLKNSNSGNRVEWELGLRNSDSVLEKETYFLNQEDENCFLVKQITDIDLALPVWESLQPNTQLTIEQNEWLVVEQLEVNFVSYFGSLQNLPLKNIKLQCIYCSNTDGECLVLSFTNYSLKENTLKAYQGWWLDPMDLT